MIFVSHSCKDGIVARPPAGFDAEQLARLRFALELRTRLVERLEPGGDGSGRVWFDRRRLKAGDEWELAIVGALHGCEAAVLLLTPEALQSSWVLREATVLADRRARWPGLVLVPVLCAGIDYTALAAQQHWAAVNVTRWQPVQAARGAWRGKDAQKDIAEIVEKVAEQLEDLAVPRDPAQARWAEEVRSHLDGLAQRKLKARLDGAAQALGVKPALAWDEPALDQLARALLQSDVAQPDDVGLLRYPLPEALGELIPGDPLTAPLTTEEVQFCQRLEPLAAPPGAALAVGAARDGAPARPPPVLLQADNRRIAELAARRSSCNQAWVGRLSGVLGEGAAPGAADIDAANRQVRLAALARKPCFVVAALQPVAGEDVAAMSAQLAARLAAPAALVAVVGRGPLPVPAAGTAVLVSVPQADEDAAVQVSDHIGMLCGRKD